MQFATMFPAMDLPILGIRVYRGSDPEDMSLKEEIDQTDTGIEVSANDRVQHGN